MNSYKIFYTILLSLLICLVIFYKTPSKKYTFTTQSNNNISNILSTTPSPPIVKFTDSTLQSGLFFAHKQGDHNLSGLNETMGSGACAFDYDNDGLEDLFIINGSGQNRFYGKLHWWQRKQTHHLFKNMGNNNFVDITNQAGLAIQSWGIGCISADFNNDGFTDLFVTNLRANQLFKNNGNGSFSEAKSHITASQSAWSTSACAADFDGDNLIDIYVANYIEFDKTNLNYEGQSEFANVGNEFFNPLLFTPSTNRIYKNMGNFIFSDITNSSGLNHSSDRSLAVRCHDINHDHLADIIVANDKSEGSNRLYINQGDFIFSDFSEKYRFRNNTGSHSIAIADIDNNGYDEILLTSGHQQNVNLFQFTLDKNGSTKLKDIARSWGLADNISSFQANWGGGLHDFDKDGRVDFFVVNGFLTPDTDAPRVAKGQPNQLWVNSGQQFFPTNSINTQLSSTLPEASRSSVFADFDNDGDMDIYISNNNNLGQLLINESQSRFHWLGVQLLDSSLHLPVIGAKVTISTSLGIQSRTISSGDSFLSDSEDRLLFGLGTATQVKNLKVIWPNGSTDNFNNFDVDQYIQIDINSGLRSYPAQPKSQQKKTKLPVKQADQLEIFLPLLLQQKGFVKTLPYIQTALTSPDAKIRETAIKLLDNRNQAESIALLVNSLNDENAEIANMALKTLCSFEDESTIRWLVSALSDKRKAMRRTAALCFVHFFREEEAMIHRKNLALPSLINLLTDPSEEIQIAAIQALAEAEHYRAMQPLTSLLGSPKPVIRSEAIRALGLIREKEAEDAIFLVLQRSNEVASVLGQSLIALKRLSYKNFDMVYNRFFQGLPPFDKVSKQSRVDTLIYLSERAIIPAQKIAKIAANFIIENPTNDEFIFQLIPLIDTANIKQTSLLFSLSNNINQDIRLQSYSALVSSHLDNRQAVLKQVVDEPSEWVKNQLLQTIHTKQLAVSVDSILPFLKNSGTHASAIKNLGEINNRYSTQVLSAQLPTSSQQALILQELAHSQFSRSELAQPYLNSNNIPIRTAAFKLSLNRIPTHYQSQNIPDIFVQALTTETPYIKETALHALSQRKELWAIKKIQKVILDTDETDMNRLTLIQKYKHPFQKNWVIMLKIAKNPNDPIRYPVMKLLSHFSEPEIFIFFKSILSNTKDSDKYNLLALHYLAENDPEWALNALL